MNYDKIREALDIAEQKILSVSKMLPEDEVNMALDGIYYMRRSMLIESASCINELPEPNITKVVRAVL